MGLNSFFHQYLIEPANTYKPDKLCVVTGYVSAEMVEHHMKTLAENGHALTIELIVGMPPIEDRPDPIYRLRQIAQAGAHGCRLILGLAYPKGEVHTKLYLWMKDDEPLCAFTGSANYSRTAFGLSKKRTELLTELDKFEAYTRYHQVLKQTELEAEPDPPPKPKPPPEPKHKNLCNAAGAGDLEDCKLWIAKGEDVNGWYVRKGKEDEDNFTSLHRAAEEGHLAVCEYLVSVGADVNAKTKKGKTPLDLTKDEEVRAYLLSVSATKYKSLLEAVKAGDLEDCKLWIAKGADVNAQNKAGGTPLHHAVDGWGGLSVCEYLISVGADVNAKTKYGSTPLHRAVSKGHLGVCVDLISAGANVNAQTKKGKTPLDLAKAWGVRSYLLRVGAIDYKILYNAVMAGDLEDCKRWIARGADVNAKDEYGWTLLHSAAGNGHLYVCKYLISVGADVHVQNKWGRTPLHSAAGNGHLYVCMYLLFRGADVNANYREGKTPLDLAKNERVRSYLLGVGAIDYESLYNAAKAGDLEDCKRWITKGADVNVQNEYGRTLLHLAAGNGHLELCEYLVSQDADVDVQDENGLTPLHRVAFWSNLALCKYLVSVGADVNARDKYGRMPLHLAASKDELEVCKYLVSAGADVHAKGKYGWTPLHWAAMGGSLTLCEYLVSAGAGVKTKNRKGETPIDLAKGEVLDYFQRMGKKRAKKFGK